MSGPAAQSPDAFPLISVVIAAHDAAATIGRTLASLSAQSFPAWQAVVVVNGTTDDTAAVVTRAAQDDPRVELVTEARAGVSLARNIGIGAARAAWILFLDADDEIPPGHLAALWAVAAAGPPQDVVYCDWHIVGHDGQDGPRITPDLRPAPAVVLAQRCPFLVHALLLPRAVLLAAGLFDEGLRVCEDWDLWQRIAASGTAFRHAPGTVAPYTLTPGSASTRMSEFLGTGLRIMRRAHQGLPAEALAAEPEGMLARSETYLVVWLAGCCIGTGKSATALVREHPFTVAPDLDAHAAASILIEAVARSMGLANPDWTTAWPARLPQLRAFLQEIEPQVGVPRLADRTLVIAARLLADTFGLGTEAGLGDLAVRSYDLADTDPAPETVPDIDPATGAATMPAPAPLPDLQAERLVGIVGRNGQEVGRFLAFVGDMVAEGMVAAILDDFRHLRAEADPGAAPTAPPEPPPEPPTTPEPPQPAPQPYPLASPALVEPPPPEGVPILAYHRVCTDVSGALARYAVTPDAFAAQMAWLGQAGFTVIRLAGFEAAIWEGAPLPDNPVLITFDDGYQDTFDVAMPILAAQGMTATTFLPTAFVGRVALWDRLYGAPAPLMGWDAVRRRLAEGFEFAAHGMRHLPFFGLSLAELRDEAEGPRRSLLDETGIQTRALAYPYGAHDEAVQRALYNLGYRLAFTTESRRWQRGDRVMAIPRLEVPGDMGPEAFARLMTR